MENGMIIDTYTVTEVTFKEFPLLKFLRLTQHSWYELNSATSFSLVEGSRTDNLEHVYQKRLKKS